MGGENTWSAFIFSRTWIIDLLYVLAGLIGLYLLQSRLSLGVTFSTYWESFGRVEGDVVLVLFSYGLGRILRILVDVYIGILTMILLWDKRIENIGNWFKDLSSSVNDQFLPTPPGNARSVFEILKVVEDHEAIKKESQKISEGDTFLRMFTALSAIGLFIDWKLCLPGLVLFTFLVLGNNVKRYRFYIQVDQFSRPREQQQLVLDHRPEGEMVG